MYSGVREVQAFVHSCHGKGIQNQAQIMGHGSVHAGCGSAIACPGIHCVQHRGDRGWGVCGVWWRLFDGWCVRERRGHDVVFGTGRRRRRSGVAGLRIGRLQRLPLQRLGRRRASRDDGRLPVGFGGFEPRSVGLGGRGGSHLVCWRRPGRLPPVVAKHPLERRHQRRDCDAQRGGRWDQRGHGDFGRIAVHGSQRHRVQRRSPRGPLQHVHGPRQHAVHRRASAGKHLHRHPLRQPRPAGEVADVLGPRVRRLEHRRNGHCVRRIHGRVHRRKRDGTGVRGSPAIPGLRLLFVGQLRLDGRHPRGVRRRAALDVEPWTGGRARLPFFGERGGDTVVPARGRP